MSPLRFAPPSAADVVLPAKNSAYKWWVVGMLWLVCFLNYADRQSINSVLPVLAKDFHFSNTQLGLIGSAFAWVYAGFALFAGLLADRVSRKALILGACVVWSIFTLATVCCGSLGGFITVRALTGLGETLYFPAAMSLLSDYHGRGTRSRAMSWHQSAVYAGTILGSWMAAVLTEKLSWRIPFYLFGPAGVVLAAVIYRGLAEPRRGAADPGQSGEEPLSAAATLAVIFRTPTALLLMLAFVIANFVAVIFLTWTPAFLVAKFGFSLGSAGLNGTLYIHLASAITVPLAGYLADRLCRRYPAGRISVQLGGMLFGALFVFLVGTTRSVPVLISGMTAFGLCKGFYDSGIFASLYDTVAPQARGTAAGIMNTVGWAGGALGPLFVGLVTDYGRHPYAWQNMSDAIACCGAIYLLGAGLLLAAIVLFTRRSAKLSAGVPR